MKKTILCLLLTAMIICTLMCTAVSAQGFDDCLTLCIDSYMTYNHGTMQQIDPENSNVVPVVVDGRTLVPARFLGELFGGQVKWDNEQKIAYIGTGNGDISIKIGESYMYVNSVKTEIDAPAQIIEGRTMVPLRAIANALGNDVGYCDGLIMIGSKTTVDNVKKEDCQEYIEYNFEPYMNKRPSIVKIFSYGDSNKNYLLSDVMLCGKRYNIGVSLHDNGFNSDLDVRVNGAIAKTIDEAGYYLYDIYLADMNPWDDYVELFCNMATDNDYLMMYCIRFSKTKASRVTFDCEVAEYETNIKSLYRSNELFVGQGRMAYNGLRLNDMGELCLAMKSNLYFQFGIKTEFFFSEEYNLCQRILPYYEVDCEPMYSLGIAPQPGDEEREMMKKGYVMCRSDCDFLSYGDYFKLLFCDNSNMVFLQTANGKQGWIETKKDPNKLQDVNMTLFFLAG